MAQMPRVAVGTIQPEADSQAILWALLETLRRAGHQVQSFCSQARFSDRHSGAAAISGLNTRHLDSWLMTPEICREILMRGMAGCDLGLVEGQFRTAVGGYGDVGGRLETLCEWLDLPALAVLDVAQVKQCCLPPRPDCADGLLLDRVAEGEVDALSTNLEALWGIPVIGALDASPRVRRTIRGLPDGARPPQRVCCELGQRFAEYWQPWRFRRLLARRELPPVKPRLFRCDLPRLPVTVALAYDEAFHRYFPDALDLLELRGATVIAFSPLRDDRLPAGSDVVYLGCGHPQRYAEQLSHNDCMKAALRDHFRRGRRIYAEGRAMAYLCQQLDTQDGAFHRMAGLFPAVAHFPPGASESIPVELTLKRTTWLGGPGQRVRGYRSTDWSMEPLEDLSGCVAELTYQYDVVESFPAAGSRLSLHVASQPELLTNIFFPCACRQAMAGSRPSMP
jgi:cobyrinic acid a,c-diamide synthase